MQSGEEAFAQAVKRDLSFQFEMSTDATRLAIPEAFRRQASNLALFLPSTISLFMPGAISHHVGYGVLSCRFSECLHNL